MFIVKILYFAIAQYVWRLRYPKRHSVHGSEGVNLQHAKHDAACHEGLILSAAADTWLK